MNKSQKLEYQQQLEKYMEDNQVYDLLENLLESVIRDKPSDPIEYLIKRLEKPEPKRIFITGPSCAHKKEIAQAVAQEYDLTVVSVPDLLSKEIEKKSPAGEEIKNAYEKVTLVDDKTVNDILFAQLKELEASNKSYVVSGYPENMIQALALQDNKFVPDKLFILCAPRPILYEKLLPSMKIKHPKASEIEARELVVQTVTEYYMYFYMKSKGKGI